MDMEQGDGEETTESNIITFFFKRIPRTSEVDKQIHSFLSKTSVK